MGLTDTHLTPEQLAERWHMLDEEGHPQTHTLKDWRRKNPAWAPRYIKFGRKVLYPMAEVERVEKARLMEATTVEANHG